MHIGDKVRLKSKPFCRDVLGLEGGQVGVVREIDSSRYRTALLISFDDADVYTSALQDEDFDIIDAGPRGFLDEH